MARIWRQGVGAVLAAVLLSFAERTTLDERRLRIAAAPAAEASA